MVQRRFKKPTIKTGRLDKGGSTDCFLPITLQWWRLL